MIEPEKGTMEREYLETDPGKTHSKPRGFGRGTVALPRRSDGDAFRDGGSFDRGSGFGDDGALPHERGTAGTAGAGASDRIPPEGCG